ncbi:MAG: hypothetical protein A2Y84_01715 [Candidatus Colwellbacteria bacterium RBG_13_48_8]|uniref:Glutamyl-tRNA amidotransferase n=1 Tax=Candidatus Colwellbacteria bacterium RBG_13_48_8 TaxID=1797685 RepID=A0A1G1YWS1_9BACT|nr:MAG: hypothetical protein A2Y84_01715 [Candidatus Colwellbacteria bacterium RBG_13_48_8]
MPKLLDSLRADLVPSLKAGDSFKSGVLRMLLAAVHNEEIAKGKDKELTDEDVIKVLRNEAKKRKEANEIYSKAGRTDLASKEGQELELIKNYLPPEMDETEVEAIVKEVVAGGETDFGKIMGEVMKRTAGRAEASLVTVLVKKALAKDEE